MVIRDWSTDLECDSITRYIENEVDNTSTNKDKTHVQAVSLPELSQDYRHRMREDERKENDEEEKIKQEQLRQRVWDYQLERDKKIKEEIAKEKELREEEVKAYNKTIKEHKYHPYQLAK